MPKGKGYSETSGNGKGAYGPSKFGPGNMNIDQNAPSTKNGMGSTGKSSGGSKSSKNSKPY